VQRALDKDELRLGVLVVAPYSSSAISKAGRSSRAATNRTGTCSPATDSVISVEPDPDRQTIPSAPALAFNRARNALRPPTEPPTNTTF